MDNIPYGYCQCGCGRKAPIASQTYTARSWVKNKPIRFIRGHANRIDNFVDEPNSSGLCMCGCGAKTPLAKHTQHGLIKGKPTRYLTGHAARVKLSRQLTLLCPECGRVFKVAKAHMNRRIHCSRSCATKNLPRGSNSRAWKGGTTAEQGYILIKVGGIYLREHRMVIERLLGRKLDKDEVVHHIDGNRKNNHPDNLKVMPRDEHCRLHHQIDKWAREYDECQNCGTTQRPHNARGYCAHCYHLWYIGAI